MTYTRIPTCVTVMKIKATGKVFTQFFFRISFQWCKLVFADIEVSELFMWDCRRGGQLGSVRHRSRDNEGYVKIASKAENVHRYFVFFAIYQTLTFWIPGQWRIQDFLGGRAPILKGEGAPANYLITNYRKRRNLGQGGRYLSPPNPPMPVSGATGFDPLALAFTSLISNVFFTMDTPSRISAARSAD